MKLNQDCIRDVLILCEDLLVMDDNGSMEPVDEQKMCSHLTQYDRAVIKYTVKYLGVADLLNVKISKAMGVEVVDFYIFDITPIGHTYLNNIRNDNNWTKVKGLAKIVGSNSIEVMMKIAEGVILAAIKSQIGL